MTKYIFVTGGVVSGIGKGIIAASLGRLLKNRGLNVFMQKFDPYINVDPGTMSPYQHGEVFVTKDGAETDLDLGHYERFIDVELTQNANITSGRVYSSVISNERQGDYLGATVQVIPHITDEIKKKIYQVAKDSEADIIITEIGGTVGDIESLPFLEAIRQVHREQPVENVIFIHTTLVPKIPGSSELKTKPTQHSFKELMRLGIKANIIAIRSDSPITKDVKRKLALFCDVNPDAIVESPNVNSLYELPLKLQEQGLDEYIVRKLKIKAGPADMDKWKAMVSLIKKEKTVINIALVGKYVELYDAYLSVSESLYHAGYHVGAEINVHWLNSKNITEESLNRDFSGIDGIIVPGGFGQKGIEGKILATKYARENKIPFFGICLGLQVAVVEYARNVCNLKDATSSEWDLDTKTPIIRLLEEQVNQKAFGGTQRLGNYKCYFKPDTKASKLYQSESTLERHRHRYEVNNDYRKILEDKGLIISGVNQELDLIEIIELKDHPWFMACQFHPEFKSRPNRPHPLFYGFVEASLKNHNQ